MSLATWRKEFYPIHVGSDAYEDHMAAVGKSPRDIAAAAIAHSLHKWRGLTKENLEKHNLEKPRRSYVLQNVSGPYGESFAINSNSCSLCEEYYRRNAAVSCGQCPLTRQVYSNSCESDGSPFAAFVDNGDAAPMIKLLEEELAFVEAQYQPPKE